MIFFFPLSPEGAHLDGQKKTLRFEYILLSCLRSILKWVKYLVRFKERMEICENVLRGVRRKDGDSVICSAENIKHQL